MTRSSCFPYAILSLGQPLALILITLTTMLPGATAAADQIPTWRLHARVVAVGLPEVAGVRQVGRFHSGGPIPANPEFLLSAATGKVLDPERVLVAVGTNFGARLGQPSHAAGSVLSIDPDAEPLGRALVVPKEFGAAGGQAIAAGGAIQLYTVQSLELQNRSYNPDARTSEYSAASGPRYLSINNAFGRPWIANAPHGLGGPGSVTVVDPDGAPLNNAPSAESGGVFVGDLTNREWTPKGVASSWLGALFNYRASGQLTPGAMAHGALGTAFLGPSPDGSGFAVFAVVTADGAIAQIHVQDGLDGLAPADTVGAVANGASNVIGIAFKWNPERVLYVADPVRDRLVLLNLSDDQRHFNIARTSVVTSPALKQPVDLAAAVPEIANPQFASHTTLAGGSDLYVLNRGDGSLLRLSQDGRLLARAEIDIPDMGKVPGGRLRALAVSADAQRVWLTIEGELPGFPGHEGALIEVSAFDAKGQFARDPTALSEGVRSSAPSEGDVAFHTEFMPETGLGPLFNAQSCVTCHPGPGGISTSEEHFVRRVARMDPGTGRVAPVGHPNSPVARRHSVLELGYRNAPSAEMPRLANVTSLRMPLALYNSGRLDEIPDAVIEAQAVAKGDGIHGRTHYVTSVNGEQRVGRYGWKAQIATLDEMVADAFANEIGIISPPTSQADATAGPPEDDGSLVQAVVAYLRTLKPPEDPSP